MTSLEGSTAQSNNSPGTSSPKENVADSKPSCTVIDIKNKVELASMDNVINNVVQPDVNIMKICELGSDELRNSAETSSSTEQKNSDVDRRERVLNKMSILQVDERIVKMVNDTRISISSDGRSICSEGRDVCRICHGCGHEPLISPCRCAGSAKFVHASCLITWFKKSSRTACELCCQYIKIEKKFRRLSQWEGPKEKPFAVLWCIAFHVSLIINLLAIVFHAAEGCVTPLCVMFYVLNTLGLIMNIFYLMCWYPTSVFYCRNWVALNEEWTLVEKTKPSADEHDNDGTSKKELDENTVPN